MEKYGGELREAIEKAELVDGHAHNLVDVDSSLPFISCFSEANGDALSYAPHTLSFKAETSEITANGGSTSNTITFMDSYFYNAATKGYLQIMWPEQDRLHLILTPTKNTVLHICIASHYSKSRLEFVDGVLTLCPSLLLQVNTKGETPLHIAARYGFCKTSEVLIKRAKTLHIEDLERGIVVAKEMLRMTTNKDKDTALHEAVRHNHFDVVRLLTREDPDFSCPANDAGETPLYLAAERGFNSLVKEMLTNCTSPAFLGPKGRTVLHAAVISNNEGMTEDILKKKRDLTKMEDDQGWTPIHYATHLGYVFMVKLLLEADNSAAYYQESNSKRTPLHIAARRGHRDILKELLTRFPDCCEIVDDKGQNVLHSAVMSRNGEIVQIVLENTLHYNLINEKDTDGNTPLHQLSASVCYAPVLIQHPIADKMALNNDNMNPVDIILNTDELLWGKAHIVREFKRASAKASCRNVTIKDDGERIEDNEKDFINQLKKGMETHLIVATLIATVTFAAGFTLPGGIQDQGPDKGTANLARKASFKAFAIANTMAMVLASSSVFIHLFLAMRRKRRRFVKNFLWAFFLTIGAMGSMVVAFMTGVYAMLEHSSGLDIATCVIAGLFFLFYYKPFLWPVRSSFSLSLILLKLSGLPPSFLNNFLGAMSDGVKAAGGRHRHGDCVSVSKWPL